jgi:hypothetical protein
LATIKLREVHKASSTKFVFVAGNHMWNFGKPHVEFFLKSEMDDVSINKEDFLLIETSLLRLENLGLCRWKPHVEFWETTCGISGNHMWNFF